MSKPMRRRPAARSPRSRRLARLLAVLGRVLLVLVTLQFSGITHGLVDVVQATEPAFVHDDGSGCPYEEQGQDCPPGCPKCHCVHANHAVAPAVGACVVESAVALGDELGGHDALAPPRGMKSRLDRPPRAIA